MSGLTAQQLAAFDRDGYLVVEDVLTDIELDDIRTDYEHILRT